MGDSNSAASEPIEVYFEKKLRTSDKSVLFDFGNDGEHWIPKSQITRERAYHDGSGEITIPQWLAENRGLV